jgi:hypothetical protein
VVFSNRSTAGLQSDDGLAAVEVGKICGHIRQMLSGSVPGNNAQHGAFSFPNHCRLSRKRRARSHVPVKGIRFADKDMRQHENLRRFRSYCNPWITQ